MCLDVWSYNSRTGPYCTASDCVLVAKQWSSRWLSVDRNNLSFKLVTKIRCDSVQLLSYNCWNLRSTSPSAEVPGTSFSSWLNYYPERLHFFEVRRDEKYLTFCLSSFVFHIKRERRKKITKKVKWSFFYTVLYFVWWWMKLKWKGVEVEIIIEVESE